MTASSTGHQALGFRAFPAQALRRQGDTPQCRRQLVSCITSTTHQRQGADTALAFLGQPAR